MNGGAGWRSSDLSSTLLTEKSALRSAPKIYEPPPALSVSETLKYALASPLYLELRLTIVGLRLKGYNLSLTNNKAAATL